MWKKLKSEYEFLCMQFIRPNRAVYSIADLGYLFEI